MSITLGLKLKHNNVHVPIEVTGPRHVHELITLHICAFLIINNLPQNLPNDLQSFLFCVYILCTSHMQWNQCPMTHPFTAKGIHYMYIPGRRERSYRHQQGQRLKFTISVTCLNTCSRPWRVDFSTTLNSFSSIFTVSSGTPFVKQNSKRSEEL